MSLSNTCLATLFIIRCSCYLVFSSFYLYIFFEVVLSPRRLVVIDTPRSIGVNPFRTPARTLLLVYCVWSIYLSIDVVPIMIYLIEVYCLLGSHRTKGA